MKPSEQMREKQDKAFCATTSLSSIVYGICAGWSEEYEAKVERLAKAAKALYDHSTAWQEAQVRDELLNVLIELGEI